MHKPTSSSTLALCPALQPSLLPGASPGDAPSAVVLPSKLPWKQSQGTQNLPLSLDQGGPARGGASFNPAAFILSPWGLQLQKQQGQGKETSCQGSLGMLQLSLGC